VESVARTTVNLEVSLTELEGNIMLWLAPPPSNNLWISFLEPPKLKLTAKPLNMHTVVQYTAMVRPRALSLGLHSSRHPSKMYRLAATLRALNDAISGAMHSHEHP
jgi:hypothetical protein